jgi:hypothetical protein
MSGPPFRRSPLSQGKPKPVGASHWAGYRALSEAELQRTKELHFFQVRPLPPLPFPDPRSQTATHHAASLNVGYVCNVGYICSHFFIYDVYDAYDAYTDGCIDAWMRCGAVGCWTS